MAGSQTFNPEGHPPFAPTYSHISVVPISPTAKLISFAGQIGYDSKTKSMPSTLPEQVKIALSNLAICLDAAGAAKTDIIQIRHYVVKMHSQDPEVLKLRSHLYTEFMGGHKPPSTLIGVDSLATKECLYEIEAVAVVTT